MSGIRTFNLNYCTGDKTGRKKGKPHMEQTNERDVVKVGTSRIHNYNRVPYPREKKEMWMV